MTITPLLMVTVSAAVGGPEPPHVAGLLQLPLTEAVYAAALAGAASTNSASNTNTAAKTNDKFLILLFMELNK
ncbi:MAG: hypothetical protein A2Z15_08410 [Chloroflexi bacterium RBG_16_50_11]|nr:MAG: hypothetical protein A2Z15_08410 [Chloroflexi bacterium RBG_16_50_11]